MPCSRRLLFSFTFLAPFKCWPLEVPLWPRPAPPHYDLQRWWFRAGLGARGARPPAPIVFNASTGRLQGGAGRSRGPIIDSRHRLANGHAPRHAPKTSCLTPHLPAMSAICPKVFPAMRPGRRSMRQRPCPIPPSLLVSRKTTGVSRSLGQIPPRKNAAFKRRANITTKGARVREETHQDGLPRRWSSTTPYAGPPIRSKPASLPSETMRPHGPKLRVVPI